MSIVPVAVYINFPFCDGCNFCHDPKVSDVKSRMDNYVKALINEIYSKKPQDVKDTKGIQSIMFGGVGASFVAPKQIEKIIKTLEEVFDIYPWTEITIECSPIAVTDENLHTWDKVGINRISLALHSCDDLTLRILDKKYNVGEVYRALDSIAFYNENSLEDDLEDDMEPVFKINVDLTLGIPVTRDMSEMNLRRGSELELAELLEKYPQIDHVSLYDLFVEDGTEMARQLSYEELYEQNADAHVAEALLVRETLTKFGFSAYETYHWSRPGFECIYNQTHHEIENECYAFGAGATGLIENVRYDNYENLDMYILSPDKAEHRAIRTNMEKINDTIINQLGTADGIDVVGLRKLGLDILLVRQHEIEHLKNMKLIKTTKNTLKMTKAGSLLVNYALSELLFDEEDLRS